MTEQEDIREKKMCVFSHDKPYQTNKQILPIPDPSEPSKEELESIQKNE